MGNLPPPSTSLYYFPWGIPHVFMAFVYRVSLPKVTGRDARFDNYNCKYRGLRPPTCTLLPTHSRKQNSWMLEISVLTLLEPQQFAGTRRFTGC